MITNDIIQIPGKWRQDVTLANSCWFNVGGKADWLFKPSSTDSLVQFINMARLNNIQYACLGVGSNLLVRDEGYRGVIIKLGREFNYIKIDDNLLEVGAGVLDNNLAKWALENEFKNFEFLIGVPGTIGGALMMNAGCYGGEINDIIVKAEVVNTLTGKIEIVTKEDIDYTYRKSNLNFTPIFTRAWFKLDPGDKFEISTKMENITKLREETQPLHSKTGGSTFKNPSSFETPLKAWQLIDQVGLRGAVIGGAKFSEHHCNFLINFNNASAKDLEDLGELARARIFDKFGIKLAWEIKIIGEVGNNLND